VGTRVVDLGDVNRDGFVDSATSSTMADNLGVLQAGRVDWFAGGSPPANGALVFAGSHQFDRVGSALAGRGDVNGDGYHDLLIGAREWDSGGIQNRGAAWVLLGGPGGLAASPAWTREGSEAGAGLGASVAFADLDGDGYTDVVVGSTPGPPSLAASGRVEVFYGGPGGVATNPGLVILPNPPRLTVGGTVAALGDVNGDAVCDLGVGSPGEDGNRGRVDVYAGSIGRSQSNLTIWRLAGTIVDGRLGTAIEGGGDVDGDSSATSRSASRDGPAANRPRVGCCSFTARRTCRKSPPHGRTSRTSSARNSARPSHPCATSTATAWPTWSSARRALRVARTCSTVTGSGPSGRSR
jgi:hypothetical protein